MKKTKLLTTAEVANILRISIITLYRKAKNQEIKCYKLGRKILFEEDDIERYLRENIHTQI